MDNANSFHDKQTVQMPDHTLTGDIRTHRAFRSEILGNNRNVLVYLPPGYRRTRTRRYPVLYLQDGQNMFDAATAFGYTEWRADETAERLIEQNLIEPIIMVAVANIGSERIHEYAPTRGRIEDGKRKRSKGRLRQYGKFLANELKPFIDTQYRTLPEAETTGLGGSSLGGLATLVLGLWFPNVFRNLAVMSPSIWWDDCTIYNMVEKLNETTRPPLTIWLDTGTREPGWERAAVLRDKLVESGWRLHDDLQYLQAEGADHSERAWSERLEEVLRFLYPPSHAALLPIRRQVKTEVLRRLPA
ncbi:MAG: alpha/beta hydrolase-fold protein [Chthoniobacterales bacterium]